MELIRDVIEWVSSESLSAFATVFPFLLLGLVGLYVLWLVLGYLRVSQVGVRDGHAVQPAVALPPAPESPGETALPTAPRGVPYCAVDGLAYPVGARFCARCERDLVLDCVNCGATLPASAASCYRCGTRTGVAGGALPG
jgi:hypothetical protein